MPYSQILDQPGELLWLSGRVSEHKRKKLKDSGPWNTLKSVGLAWKKMPEANAIAY